MSDGSENVLVVSPGRFVAPITPMTQATWHLDPQNVTGTASDSNDGLTDATAILSWVNKSDGSLGEYVRRTGVDPFVNITMDVYVHSDLPQTDMLAFFGFQDRTARSRFTECPP